jgi:hypothetical protein
MVNRRIAAGLTWGTQKMLTIVVLAALLIICAVPVVIFTSMGLSEAWAYLAFASFLVGVTTIVVGLCMWGVKKSGTFGKEGK